MVLRHVTHEEACSHTAQAPEKPRLCMLSRHFPHLSPFKMLPALVRGAARVPALCGAYLCTSKPPFSILVSGELLISILGNNKNPV